ncbi:MAG: DUF2185 domain-containing protein [Paludibacteraceae bacterium]|nr:DUF2185 domain-containing protein [Paludibacteraceae bacterium]
MKEFKKKEEEIVQLISMPGYCLATDKITCEGKRVGYMYREEPDNERDSGWRFFSGEEDQEYVDDPENIEMFSLNTIANYDPDIISLLNAPYGSAFEREEGSGDFVGIEFPESDD